MKMPTGVHAGTPLHLLPTPYMLWFVSQDAIRHKQWPLVDAILDVLAERFTYPGLLRAELMQRDPPPDYWKAGKRAAKKRDKSRRRRYWHNFRRQGLVSRRQAAPDGSLVAGLDDRAIVRRITALGGLRR
ncbi:hypothetical protein CDEF62S_04674 [Castellaniella defragrans]